MTASAHQQEAESADDLCEVLITAPDEQWLIGLTTRLIEQRLAACGHHSAIRSVYTWQDEIHDEPEAAVRLHTRRTHVDAITRIVCAEHPYDVPGIIATPLLEASSDYAHWIRESTSGRPDR